MTDDLTRCPDCGHRHAEDSLCLPDDYAGSPTPLDAPLSPAEAEECRRVAGGIDLDEIERLCQEATPGPWGRYGWRADGAPVLPTQGILESAPGLSIGSVTHTEPIARFSGYLLPVEANVEFTIHAREAVPALVARVRELEAALETIRRDYGKVCGDFLDCDHPACASSSGAWLTADQALRNERAPDPLP